MRVLYFCKICRWLRASIPPATNIMQTNIILRFNGNHICLSPSIMPIKPQRKETNSKPFVKMRENILIRNFARNSDTRNQGIPIAGIPSSIIIPLAQNSL